MNETIDKPTLLNLALSMVGALPVDLNTENEQAEKADNAWRLCVDQCFGLHDWYFARRTTRLNRRNETPNNGWKYQFDLSGDRLGPPLKLLACAGQSPAPLRDFDLEGGSVFTNAEECWAREKVLVDPEFWDPTFRSAFVVALQAYLSIPFSHDENMHKDKYAEAFGTPREGGSGGMFGRLIAQDRAGSPVGSGPAPDPLTTAHSSAGASPGSWYGRF